MIVLSSSASRAAAVLRGPGDNKRRPLVGPQNDPGRTAQPEDPPDTATRDSERSVEELGPDDLKGLQRKALLFIVIWIAIYIVTFPIAMKVSPNFQGMIETMPVAQKSGILVQCVTRSAWMFFVAFSDRASPETYLVVLPGWILSLIFLLKGLSLSFKAKGSSTWWMVLTCIVATLLSPILALILAALSPNRKKGAARTPEQLTRRSYGKLFNDRDQEVRHRWRNGTGSPRKENP